VLPLARRLPGAPPAAHLFRELTDGGRRGDTVLLESAELAAPAAERSILVVRAAVRAECRGPEVTLRALSEGGQAALGWVAEQAGDRVARRRARSLTISSPRQAAVTESERLARPSPLDALRWLTTGWRLLSRPLEEPLLAAGVFGYDLVDAFEDLPAPAADPLGFPDFAFWLPEVMVVIDHRRDSTWVVAEVFGGGPSTEALYHDAEAAIEELSARCLEVRAAGEGTMANTRAGLEVDLDDEAYGAVVRTLKQRITAGDVFQIVPSRTFSAPCPDPLRTYEELRRRNPSPYMFYVRHQDWTLLGASPETCVKVTGTPRQVEIRPIAGTRPRGRRADGSLDLDRDSRLEAELRLDRKELAEHLMLVDLARNDVARVSVPGTRQVSRLLGVERYSTVMHLVSHVVGELRPELDALQAYAACANMGTLVGAPKIKAAEILRRVETTRRGPYGGAVGYLGAGGGMDTAIVIRSALVAGGRAHVRAGAGVVHDSVPRLEAEETRRKAQAVLSVLGVSEEGAS